jgi:hypothetical protein
MNAREARFYSLIFFFFGENRLPGHLCRGDQLLTVPETNNENQVLCFPWQTLVKDGYDPRRYGST